MKRDLAMMVKEYQGLQEQDPEKWRTWTAAKRYPSLRSLSGMKERILRYSIQMERSNLKKHETLPSPVRDRIRRSIASVAQRHGPAYILDSSSPQFLHSEGAVVITQAVVAQFSAKNRKTP